MNHYVFNSELHDESRIIAAFSSHWAAVAAMIRCSDPSFVSIGGDKREDLAIEATLVGTAG